MKSYDSSGYTVTVAQPEDAEEVLSLLKDVAEWLKQKGEEQWETVADGEDDAEIISAIHEQQTYIIRSGRQLIATFTIYPVKSEWDAMLWGSSESGAAYLHKLAILPTESGKGFGNKILGWLEGHLAEKNVPTLRLDCIEDNEKLNEFYSKNGYRKVGSRHGFSLYEKDLTNR